MPLSCRVVMTSGPRRTGRRWHRAPAGPALSPRTGRMRANQSSPIAAHPASAAVRRCISHRNPGICGQNLRSLSLGHLGAGEGAGGGGPVGSARCRDVLRSCTVQTEGNPWPACSLPAPTVNVTSRRERFGRRAWLARQLRPAFLVESRAPASGSAPRPHVPTGARRRRRVGGPSRRGTCVACLWVGGARNDSACAGAAHPRDQRDVRPVQPRRASAAQEHAR